MSCTQFSLRLLGVYFSPFEILVYFKEVNPCLCPKVFSCLVF